MQIAALYDVHGNLPALEAVLADPRLASADRIVMGGDLVAGPMPRECLERVRRLGDRVLCIRGNGDRETVSPPDDGPLVATTRFAHERLTPAQLVEIADWPLTVGLRTTGLGDVLFCHATPVADTPIVTRVTPAEDVLRVIGPVDAGVVVCGHTHVQFDRRVGRIRLVNAGSVGAPYEGSPGARWALLGETVEQLVTPYDVSAALDLLEATGFPEVEDWLGPAVRGEVSAAEATDAFESRRCSS